MALLDRSKVLKLIKMAVRLVLDGSARTIHVGSRAVHGSFSALLDSSVMRRIITGTRSNHTYISNSALLQRNANACILKQKETEDITANAEYPQIKPKYPPGSWGNMNYKYAWQWHELKERMLSVSGVQQRQNELLTKNTLAMLKEPRKEHRIHDFKDRVNALIDEAATVLKLEPINDHPSILQFRKYATKTHLLKWEQIKPKVFDGINVDILNEAVNYLKKHISDHLLLEYEIIERAGMSPSTKRAYLCKSIIRCISESLIIELGKNLTHLRTCHYDEDVTVRALWNRYGFDRKKRLFTYDPDNEKFESVEDQPVISEAVFDAMVRSHIPLPEFESEFGRGIQDLELPKLMYKPSAWGENRQSQTLLKSVLAGHRFGDPCEYGLTGILSTCNTHEIEQRCGPRVAQDCRLAMGLTNTFTWLAAQACNQGFNHVIDLTYPLTSQTIMTDGEKISFLAYQLNTLELWKDDIGNSTANLCWSTHEMALYHCIEQGHVRELNDDALRLIVKMFMLVPIPRTYDLKPTICDKLDSLHLKCDFVSEKVTKEEVIIQEQFIVD